MIRSLLVAMLATLLVVCTATFAHAGDRYNHNGSIVELIWTEGDGMVVKYVQPKDSIPVTKGTVLFHGASPANGSIYGEAYLFSSVCGRIGYEVTGWFDENGNFSLEGKAPVRNDNCRVVRNEWNSNSKLRFTAR